MIMTVFDTNLEMYISFKITSYLINVKAIKAVIINYSFLLPKGIDHVESLFFFYSLLVLLRHSFSHDYRTQIKMIPLLS